MDKILSMFPGDDEEEKSNPEARVPNNEEAEKNNKNVDENVKINKENIKKEILEILDNKYKTFPVRDDHVNSILNDSFINDDVIDVKKIVLRLLVLEKLFTLLFDKWSDSNDVIKRLEHHTDTVRKNMIILNKKIDVQTGRIGYGLDGY
ncbi:117L protein [Yaba-like disease virus]|uniref:117L protein n=1 Tax=Yaba-like disease virus TaxID=132475 RepID=Q9DHJ6_YLDV|nr:117L protein [Yaba-like disease virus]CAC21355.1 117L protein [Yaba-like disease virus]